MNIHERPLFVPSDSTIFYSWNLVDSILTFLFTHPDYWNDYYDNKPDSERDLNDSLIKFLLIEDCENDYKLMIERSRELRLSTAMDAYAVGDYATAYKEFKILRKFITEQGKIIPGHVTGVCAKHQRHLSNAIKRARNIALLPYSVDPRYY